MQQPSMINDYKYRVFFEKLEMSVRKELEPQTQFNHQISNEYFSRRIPKLTIESTFNLNGRSFKIITELDTNFPRKKGPTIYTHESVKSNLINSKTNEIDYGKIHQWNFKTSKIGNLILTIYNYLRNHPPTESQEMILISKIIGKIKSDLNNVVNTLDPNSVRNRFSEEGRAMLNNPETNYELIYNLKEIRAIREAVASVLQKSINYVRKLNRRDRGNGKQDKRDYEYK